MHETQEGFHEFVAGRGPPGQHPFSLALDWGPDRLLDFLNPLARETFLIATGRGVIRAGSWFPEAPCTCSVAFRCFSEGRIRTRLYFDVEGRSFEYIGERLGLRPWNLHRTGTLSHGVAYDLETGEEVCRSRSSFRISSIPSFLMSVSRKPLEQHNG